MSIRLLLPILLLILFASCQKENETPDYPALTDYYPLEVGKYITYDLDSTVFVNFGKSKEVHHYQVKLVVDAAITDNEGRPSYRIIRYKRNAEGEPWVADNSILITRANNAVEFVENNLRYIKLTSPIKTGNSWRGNSYIDTYQSAADLRYLDNWDYIYDSVGAPLAIHSFNFDQTLKVFHIDEEIGDPLIQGTAYAEKTYSLERYARGVGLIYKEFLHWEYQGVSQSYSGYGVKLSVKDFN